MAETRTPRERDYEVGYAKPPKASRFVPGKSGNPRGRPKGARSYAAMLKDALQKKIPVTENGRARKLSTFEVILRRLANDAMRGDVRAIKIWISLADRYGASEPAEASHGDLLNEDMAILRRYFPDFDEPSGAEREPTAEVDVG